MSLFLPSYTVKIKKNSLTWSWESSRGHCRAHYLFDCGPSWKRPLADGYCSLHYILAQLKEEKFPTTWQQPSQWATMILRTLSFLQLMFCLGQPSQLHLFLCKRASSPLFSGLAYGFAVACMFKLQFSAMPKSFFFWLVKLIDIFIFKVHNSLTWTTRVILPKPELDHISHWLKSPQWHLPYVEYFPFALMPYPPIKRFLCPPAGWANGKH